MNIETIVVGPLSVNCYILYDDDHTGMVIDPGADGGIILERLKKREIKLERIINTHGHFDHVGANRILRDATGAELLIHGDDAELLMMAELSAAQFGLAAEPSPEPDGKLNDGDMIEAGQVALKVIHTPGHSPGGVSLLSGKNLFTGDTLFAGSIGRTDLPGGNYEELIETVRSRIFTLGDSIEIFPGHGPGSTIGYEKAGNPFFTTGSFYMGD